MITQAFAARVFDEHGTPRTADEFLDPPLKEMLARFSGSTHVHAPRRRPLPPPGHPASDLG